MFLDFALFFLFVNSNERVTFGFLIYFQGKGNLVNGTWSYDGFYSATSDDQVFRQLALTYARNHPIMKTGGGCHGIFNFTDGIVNGAHW